MQQRVRQAAHHKRIVDFGLEESLWSLDGILWPTAYNQIYHPVVNRTVLRSDDGALPVRERDVVGHDETIADRHVRRALLRLLQLLEQDKVARDDHSLRAHFAAVPCEKDRLSSKVPPHPRNPMQ
eukprot:scaffold20106_cov111-Isochrysis_galbana.AAC.4